MAKKVVATLKREGAVKAYTKVIRMIKSEKTGAYTFEEKVMEKELVKIQSCFHGRERLSGLEFGRPSLFLKKLFNQREIKEKFTSYSNYRIYF
jgi:hypothetical protein